LRNNLADIEDSVKAVPEIAKYFSVFVSLAKASDLSDCSVSSRTAVCSLEKELGSSSTIGHIKKFTDGKVSKMVEAR
jgi:hypothetical protein